MRSGLFFRVSTVVNSQGHGCLSIVRYCVPMDNDRPSLDLKYFEAICPDKNGMSMSKCDSMDRN